MICHVTNFSELIYGYHKFCSSHEDNVQVICFWKQEKLSNNSYTVKLVLISHAKEDQKLVFKTKVLKTDYRLMQQLHLAIFGL